MAQVGEPQRIIIAEPLHEPVPAEPEREPAPQLVPEEEPERVPA